MGLTELQRTAPFQAEQESRVPEKPGVATPGRGLVSKRKLIWKTFEGRLLVVIELGIETMT